MSRTDQLVDLEELKQLMSSIDLQDPKAKDANARVQLRNECIQARWLRYVDWWDSRSRKAKWKYFLLRGTVIVGTVSLPALVGLRELRPLSERAWIFSAASILVSFIVAICAGLESLFGFGEIWREKRAAAELIKSEGFSFLELTGDYSTFDTHADAFKLFAKKVEDLIRSEIKDYIVAVSPRPGNGPGKN
jgi:hypothetical protein